ncbi:hypothetical protein CWE09_00995 [Aliidiomarina minuta]|uniref:Uncharacterized protein n=1 Tax=Aliidiomarina minuta TaxID=880057 RepID=A0A432W5J6_9GAMM|nr:hypothetical protein [Aliidiomarina minuta]RUO25343.1 hypothetical protein CWE09_00995 [Aliidiomarina minuta]
MKAQSRVIKQRGQVVLLMTLLLLGLWLGLQYVLSLSDRAQRQTHIQQVTDQATEAFAIIAARDLNYKAVTNRAMLANHIAIAQMVGLSSWFQMMDEVTRNSALVTSWVPYLNTVMANLSRSVQQLQQPVNQALRAGIQAEHLLIQVISSSQQLFHAAAAATALLTSQGLVQKNDPSLELVLLNHQTLPDLAYTWLRYQHRDNDNQTFVDLLKQSRDPFNERRSYSWFRVGGVAAVHLEKWGGTEAVPLGRQHFSWQGVDIATLRVQLTRWIRRTIPVGGGAAYVGTRPPVRGRVSGDLFGGAYAARAGVSRRAALQGRYMGQLIKVPGHQRIANHRPPPSITMLVRERQQEGQPPGGWAAAKAQLVYQRPALLWPRSDGLTETANLFNGLWQARLVPLTAAELWLLGQQA